MPLCLTSCLSFQAAGADTIKFILCPQQGLLQNKINLSFATEQYLEGCMCTCRGSSGAQPAVSDNASGHSGSTLPCSKLEVQQFKPKLVDLVHKGMSRKRELT